MTSTAPQPGQQAELPPTVTIGSMLALGVLELLRMNNSALATMLANSLQNEINQSVATHQAIQQQLTERAAAAAAEPPVARQTPDVADPGPALPAAVAPVQPVVNASPAVAAAMAELGGEMPVTAAQPVESNPVVVEPSQAAADAVVETIVAESPLAEVTTADATPAA